MEIALTLNSQPKSLNHFAASGVCRDLQINSARTKPVSYLENQTRALFINMGPEPFAAAWK
jgi:hypothetical protein